MKDEEEGLDGIVYSGSMISFHESCDIGNINCHLNQRPDNDR